MSSNSTSIYNYSNKRNQVLRLINEFESYEPKNDNYNDCYRLINNKYEAFFHECYRIGDITQIKLLTRLRNLKLEKYKDKFSEPIIECEKDDKCAQIYLEESTRMHKQLIKKKEYQRLQQQEYEETKKQIKEQLHSLVKMPSILFQRLTTSSKKDDTKVKINIWSDKIIEMISDLSAWKSDKCKNLNECIEKITIIIDIINLFVERPNTMVNRELSENNNYNIQKNKIYENFLEDYKITFTDKELEHPEYLKLLEDYKKIIIVLQNMKLDDCKNTYSKEKTGGKKYKNLNQK
jgi:hypothetical protein